jgi:hypothetical protein
MTGGDGGVVDTTTLSSERRSGPGNLRSFSLFCIRHRPPTLPFSLSVARCTCIPDGLVLYATCPSPDIWSNNYHHIFFLFASASYTSRPSYHRHRHSICPLSLFCRHSGRTTLFCTTSQPFTRPPLPPGCIVYQTDQPPIRCLYPETFWHRSTTKKDN